MNRNQVGYVIGFVAALFLLTSGEPQAAETGLPAGVQVAVRPEPQTATVGDPIRIRIEIAHPPAVRIAVARPPDELGDFALLAFTPEAPREVEGTQAVRESVTLVVAAYKTGDLSLPGIPIKFVTADGSEHPFTTAPSRIRIQSVLDGKNAQLKDLKKQAEIDEPFPLLRWVAIIAAIAGLAALVWWRLRRSRAGRATAAARPRLSLLELAEAELRDLLARGLVEKGFIKQFYVGISEVARKMLEGGYEIATAEKTTTEIMDALSDKMLPHPDQARLARIEALLEACDLVKFAKYVPGSDEIEAATKSVFELLDHCRHRRAAAAPGAEPAVGAA